MSACEKQLFAVEKKQAPLELDEVDKVALSLNDLEIAKRRLSEKDLTLVVAKGRQVIFEAKSHGVSGFMEGVEELKEALHGASVADRVVGKAVALLCVYVDVEAVYANTMSKAAKALLEGNAVHVEWNTLVENILGADKLATCPFERLVEAVTDPAYAYRKLKRACSSASRQ